MTRSLQPTRNGLDQSIRARSTILLEQVLVDLLELANQARTCHWVVRGPSFLSLHEHLDKLDETLRDAADEVAERVTALGGLPWGTSRAVARGTRVADLPEIHAQGDVLNHLADRIAAVGNEVRLGIDRAAGFNDAVTADLLTGLSASLDKELWFLEAWAHSG